MTKESTKARPHSKPYPLLDTRVLCCDNLEQLRTLKPTNPFYHCDWHGQSADTMAIMIRRLWEGSMQWTSSLA